MMNDEEHGVADDIQERQSLIPSSSLDHRHAARSQNCISNFETGISLAKAIMGAGSFTLPWAFSNMGYVAGPIFLMILMSLSVYSLHLLVQCARSGLKTASTTYVAVAHMAFGTMGSRLTYVASVSASMGVCGSYLLFIAVNLYSLASSSGSFPVHLTQGHWVLFILPCAVILSSVRDMKHFAFASLLGDVSVVLGMLVVIVYGFMFHHNSFGEDCIAVGSIGTMPLAFGAIGYLFLIHFLVLPIESSMAHPQDFTKVAVVTFGICAILSGSFGIVGYLLFGPATEQIVLLNVQGSWFVSAVKLLLCVDLLLTYPVVMRPSIAIVEQSLTSSWLVGSSKAKGEEPGTYNATHHGSPSNTLHFVVCLGLGLVAAGLSMFVPAFGLLSGLVGGVSQTFLAFVLPPLMLAKLRHGSSNPRDSQWWKQVLQGKQIGLVVLGFLLIIWTLISTRNELGKDGDS